MNDKTKIILDILHRFGFESNGSVGVGYENDHKFMTLVKIVKKYEDKNDSLLNRWKYPQWVYNLNEKCKERGRDHLFYQYIIYRSEFECRFELEDSKNITKVKFDFFNEGIRFTISEILDIFRSENRDLKIQEIINE